MALATTASAGSNTWEAATTAIAAISHPIDPTRDIYNYPRCRALVELVAHYCNISQRDVLAVERALTMCADLRSLEPLSHISTTSRLKPVVHRAKDRWTKDELVALVTRYQAGESAASLGDELGMANQTIMRLLKSQGVALHRPRLTQAEKEEAIRLYLDGWSLAKVGAKLGRDHSSIRNVLIRAEVERRNEHGRER